tara:strand:- start:783 stop:1433 length:651 start_codon:yes stop_codon:yes gene_type:complete
MNYGEIKTASQQYTDRYDSELVTAIPAFTSIVESKINTSLRVGKQSVRAQIWLENNEEYYGLPSDFGGFRDVEILSSGNNSLNNNGGGGGGTPLTYLAPEEMNKLNRNQSVYRYYTVIANQIQIAPPTNNEILEVVYYSHVPPLSADTDTNWLSQAHPDVYIFGLCTEISAFAKDAEGFGGYDARFKECLAMITQDDQIERWSGPALRSQVDGMIV